MSRFPAAFRPPAFRFSVIRYPPRSWALLAVGLPDLGPDLGGVTTFRTCELQPGWVPSLPRGRRCSSRPSRFLDRRLPLYRGQSLDPAPASHRAGLCMTRHQREFKQFTRPTFPSPVAARMERAALGLSPPGFAPRRPGADDARRGGDRPSSTDLELLAQHHIGLILQSCSSLTACDLVSHIEAEQSRRRCWQLRRSGRAGARHPASVVPHASRCPRSRPSHARQARISGKCPHGECNDPRLMREVSIGKTDLPLDAASFLACLATILELPFDALPQVPVDEDAPTGWTVSRWLGGLSLGLAPVADARSFSWAGPWIARIQPPAPDSCRYVVMYGVPSGVVWDPAGGPKFKHDWIDQGFVVAAADIASALPARPTAPVTSGAVEAICVASAAGKPVQILEAVRAIAGRGLEGDRHVVGTGTFPSGPVGKRADDHCR